MDRFELTSNSIHRSAVIDGFYRYLLQRWWQREKPQLGFCMLNPSKADAERDDATILKCMGFARRLGYGGIVVVNACAFRSTDPRGLLLCSDPVGQLNYQYLIAGMQLAQGRMVVAWGKQIERLQQRGIYRDAIRALRAGWLADEATPAQIMCLGKTVDGHPRHPVRLSYKTPLVEYQETA